MVYGNNLIYIEEMTLYVFWYEAHGDYGRTFDAKEMSKFIC